jgi:RND family efflux transporter MFP subunit
MPPLISRVFSWIVQFWRAGVRNKLITTGVVVVVGAAVTVGLRDSAAQQEHVTVTRGDLDQIVSVTGRLKPVQAVELAFQNSGRIAVVNAVVGSRVSAGALLASLDTSELYAQLRDAQAAVLGQRAKLEELKKGSRPEDIAAKESEYAKAAQDLSDDLSNIYDVLLESYAKGDNAVRVQTQSIYTSVGSEQQPQFILSFVCDCEQQKNDALSARVKAEVVLNRWRQELDAVGLAGSEDVLVKSLANARLYLATIKDTLSATNKLLSDSSVAAHLSASTLLTYRTAVSTGYTNAVAALSAVNAQYQTVTSQRLTVQKIASELALKKAGNTPETIAVQQAQVQSSQAQADRVSAQISKNAIRSPIKGIVTVMDAKVGQTATANQTLVAVISDQDLEIEANVPEVDIGKVHVGSPITVTVDALPGETLAASVVFIDPAETILDGVVNFKMKATLNNPEPRLKSGLTVNLDITVQHLSGVLIIPQVAILENDRGTFVRRVSGGVTTEVAVRLGVRGQDGMVEVLEGVSEGDILENIGIRKSP